ncbi:hypothetical protein EI555_003664, partial [Monodon monoceros]
MLAFLWAELGIEGKEEEEEQTCQLLGYFDLNGYVGARNPSLVIGGLFPIHSRTTTANESILEPVSAKCEGFNFREINERKNILPNIILGYQIFDTCFTISKSMEAALVFLTGQEENKPSFRSSTGAVLAGLVGAGGSSFSVAASRILGLYYLPQPVIRSSRRPWYNLPTFWLGLDRHIAADDDCGNYGVKVFKEKMESVTLCVAFSETVPKVHSNEKVQKAIDAITNSTARVIVLHASDIDLSPFMLEMVYHNITDRTWIASEAWIAFALIAKPEYFSYFGGSIGFSIPRADILGLKELLYDVNPGKDPNDVLTIEFWQTAFNCTWPNSSVPYNTDHRLMCYLKTLKFTTHNGMRIEVDDNGDVAGYYDILNWQLDDNGEIA